MNVLLTVAAAASMPSPLTWVTVVIVVVYMALITITALVGYLHGDQKRRRDAQRVLDRLLKLPSIWR